MSRRYGSSPVHLVAHLLALALAGYAIVQIAGLANAGRIFLFMGGAVLFHDALIWPAETALDRGAQTGLRRFINHVRIPAGLSLVLLLAFFPVISQYGEGSYRRVSEEEYQGDPVRWLLVTAALFAISGLVLLGRSVAARRRSTP